MSQLSNIRANRAQKAQKRIFSSVSVPAPVGGWNARDSYAAMGPLDAVTLTNFFPNTTSVNLRYGFSVWASGLTGTAETLLTYAGGATQKFFAATNAGNIYNVTATGAVGAAEVASLTNGRLEYVNMTTAAGSYLRWVNGADLSQVYNGTAWFIDGVGAPYDITGVTSSTLSNIHIFKSRMWFIQQNTLKAWYLPSGAIGGAATAFDLSAVATLGGYLVSMATLTGDAGYGLDDLMVFVTSMGEVLIYRGTDPASAATWALVGTWSVGAPVGKRPFEKFAGDILYLSQDGLVPLWKYLQSSRTKPKTALTDKIQSAVSAAVTSYGSNFGWQPFFFPKANQVYLNVPIAEGSNQQQYVMNTITGAWCNFTGWQASCWGIFNDDAYFGGSTNVCKAWNGLIDNAGDIAGQALQAFNRFGSGVPKRATLMRPTLLTSGTPASFIGLNFDYDLTDNTAALSFSPTSYAVWDTAKWDQGLWGGGLNTQRNWQSARGMGRAAGTFFKVACQGIEVQWANTDIEFEVLKGGLLT